MMGQRLRTGFRRIGEIYRVVLTRRRVVAVDCDDYGRGDSSYEVARFIVGLQRLTLRRRGSMRALNGVADVFLKTDVAAGLSDVTRHMLFQRAERCARWLARFHTSGLRVGPIVRVNDLLIFGWLPKAARRSRPAVCLEGGSACRTTEDDGSGAPRHRVVRRPWKL